MFGQKNKSAAEQGRGRQPRYGAGRPTGPAFSYYTSRPADTAPRRSAGRQTPDETAGKSRLPRRFNWAQLPFWSLVVLAVVCAGKLLFLGADAKVMVVGQSSVTATYLRPTSTYAAAAKTALSSSITDRTKLTADLSGAAARLQAEFPELQTVSVTVPLIGNRPLVYIQVAQPSLILQNVHGNYALNASGIVLAKLGTLPNGIPTLTDQSNATPHTGKQYLPGSTIRFISTMAYQLKAAHITVATYVLPSTSPYELDIRPEGQGFAIKCNLEADPVEQSGAAIATMQQLGSHMPVAYLDVRTPGRVYYK